MMASHAGNAKQPKADASLAASELEQGYRLMAEDRECEAEAAEWVEATFRDAFDEME